MQKRVDQEIKMAPSWLQMAKDEKLIFYGTSAAKIRNPIGGEEGPECVILTDKRLVTLCSIGGRLTAPGVPAVTTVPLSQIQAIQTNVLSWNVGTVLICLFLFILYIIPGLIFLHYMQENRGPRVNVVVGNLRVEVKFFPDFPNLLRTFITQLDLYTSFK